MVKSCARCGHQLPKESRARFCSNACRQAALRARRDGRPESIAEVVDLPSREDVRSTVESTARAELLKVGRLDTTLGQAALALAVRIDVTTAVNGYAALVKEFRETMAEAVKDAGDVEDDAVSKIRASALRLLSGS